VAVIRIFFPKVAVETGTWVDDEDWAELDQIQREQLIYRFIKNHHADALNRSHAKGDSRNPNYRWNTV
jgi:hypothetical protein